MNSIRVRVSIFHVIHLPCFYAIGSCHILLNYMYFYVHIFFFWCWPVIVVFIVVIEYLFDLLLVK